MSVLRRVLGTLCAFLGLALASPLVASADLDGAIRTFLDRQRIPGASISVVHRGRIVHAAGYGMANLELGVPASARTVFEIGSISKQFTAEAVMQLVETGALRLDDPIRRFLPTSPAEWDSISVRHLLSHTSGLRDWETLPEFSYRREYTPEEFIDLIRRFPLAFTPGDRFAYTNSGFPLLGLILEKVAGRPFEDVVADRIFKRAGMTDTRFKRPEEIVPHRAGGYVDRAGTLINGEPLRPRVIAPNGGILSTAADMARWQLALSAGTIVKPETVALMTQPLRLNDGQPVNAGLAWFVDEFRGHRVLLHNGSTVAGFSSVVYHYPDDALSVVVLMNIDRWNAVNVLATMVADRFVPGLSVMRLSERPDPDPDQSRRFLALIKDVAQRRVNSAMADSLKSPDGASRLATTLGFDGAIDRFAFLEREDFGATGRLRFGSVVRWIYRYKLVSGPKVRYYTFEVDVAGQVCRLIPEDV